MSPKGIFKKIEVFIIKDDNTGLIYADELLVLDKHQLKLMKRRALELYIRLNQELMNVGLK